MDTFELLEGTNMTLPNKIFPKLRSRESTKPIQPVVRTKPGNLCRIVKFALALPGMASAVLVLHSDSNTTLMWKLLPSATLLLSVVPNWLLPVLAKNLPIPGGNGQRSVVGGYLPWYGRSQSCAIMPFSA